MKQVELEPFSHVLPRAARQARDLRLLVRGEADWLQDVQPGTVARYSNYMRGVRKVMDIASRQDQIEAFLIRGQRTSLGIATILPEQHIVHPTEGAFDGSDLDYWLVDGAHPELHRHVARQLWVLNGMEPGFAAIREVHPQPPVGFETYMKPIGDTAVSLSTGDQPDPFGIAWDGAPARLYVTPQPFPLPAEGGN